MKVKIMVSTSGGGKSTWIQNDPEPLKKLVFSADFGMMEGDKYVFKPAKLYQAHKTCKEGFQKAILEGYQGEGEICIYVDNTNTKLRDIRPYIEFALENGVTPEIIWLNVDPKIAGPRNTHGVPQFKVEEMYQNILHMRENWPKEWPEMTEITNG